MRLDAVRELFLGTLADFIRQLRLHHVAGTFLQQLRQGDAVNHIQRVNDVTLGLGHLLAFVIADQTGHVDGLKRNLRFTVFIFDEVHGHHDHAGDPEEDNVEAGHHHAGRVELTQGVGVFRPAEGGEGPQRGGEPCIENVFILTQGNVGAQVVFLTHFVFATAYVDVAVVVIPCRDAVTPPQLTGDTPVLNIAHPGEVHVFVLLRHELNVAVFNGFDCWLGQHVRAHVPLVGQHRLDHHAAAIAVRDGQVVRFDLFQQAEGVNRRNNGFTRREAFQFLELCRDLAGVDVGFIAFGVVDFRAFADVAVKGKDVDHRQLVTTTHFVVVKVVRRGDLHAAGAFFHVGVFVAHDRDAAVNQRQHHEFANQIFVARIFRVNGHAGIAQQGFRTGGGDHQVIFTVSGFRAIGQRVADVPHGTFRFAVFHFEVGNGGAQFRVPVNQAFAAVDQVFFVQANKDFFHGIGKPLVHGEALALPVHGVAETAHLTGNGAAGFRFPLPDFVDKGVAAVVVAGFPFFSGNLTLNHHLGSDTCVVGTGLPQSVFALHALVANHGIHDGLLEGMTHMQTAGDVRRRDHDAEALLAFITIRFEIALLFPVLVKRLFDILWVVCLFHYFQVAVFRLKPAMRYAL